MGRVKNRFEHNGHEVYVFPIENALLEIEGIEIGTVLKIKNEIVMAIELNLKTDGADIAEKLSDFDFDRLEIFYPHKPIPRDPRHNSKIDYDRLKKILS